MEDLGHTTEIPKLPIRGLELVRHLDEFDGPLLSHFIDRDSGENYLKYWCDCDTTVNRWMWIRVNEASILRLTNQYVPLSFVLPEQCRDDFVFIVDENNHYRPVVIYMVDVDDIPAVYLPTNDSYLPSTSQVDEKTYAVVIEGDWSIDDLGEFPRTFYRAYSLIYGLNVLHLSNAPSFPWKADGFSAMHFFNWLSGNIPTEHHPYVHSMQYASPGFLRFGIHARTAKEVVKSVLCLKNNNSTIAGAYSDLESYIRNKKLNELSENDGLWATHEKYLLEQAKIIIRGFDVIDVDDFFNLSKKPFESAKIAMSFYRRVKTLVKYEKDNNVRFPREIVF